MSVIKSRRTESKAEFINTAREIYIATVNLLTRLSPRYTRLVADQTMAAAGNVLDEAIKANAIFAKSDEEAKLRRAHLLEAKANLAVLGTRLSFIYDIIQYNPEGAFRSSKGVDVTPGEAKKKIDSASQALGLLISKESKLLTGLLKKD